MTYQLSWIIPKRVILSELKVMTEDAQFYEWDSRVVRMLDEGDTQAALIHHIMKLDQSVNPPGLKVLTSLKALKHARNGWTMVVGIKSNPVLKVIGGLAGKILRLRVREIDTVEEALELLYKMDTTLPGITVDTR